MKTTPLSPEKLLNLAESLSCCESCNTSQHSSKGFQLAGRQAIYQALDDLIAILFPGCHGRDPLPPKKIGRAHV